MYLTVLNNIKMHYLWNFSFLNKNYSEQSAELTNISMFTDTGLLLHAGVFYTSHVKDQ